MEGQVGHVCNLPGIGPNHGIYAVPRAHKLQLTAPFMNGKCCGAVQPGFLPMAALRFDDCK